MPQNFWLAGSGALPEVDGLGTPPLLSLDGWTLDMWSCLPVLPSSWLVCFTVNLEGVVPTPEAQLGIGAAAPLSLWGVQTEVQGQPTSREWGCGLPVLGLRGSDRVTLGWGGCQRPPGTVPGTAEVLLQGVGCKPRHLQQSPAPPWGAGLSPSSPEAPPRPQQNRGPSQSDCGGLCLTGGPLHPSPGASLRLPTSFHTHSGGVTCRTLTFTFLTQSNRGPGYTWHGCRCQLALQGGPRGSAGSLRPRLLGLISHACRERSGCVSAFVVQVCFPLLQP